MALDQRLPVEDDQETGDLASPFCRDWAGAAAVSLAKVQRRRCDRCRAAWPVAQIVEYRTPDLLRGDTTCAQEAGRGANGTAVAGGQRPTHLPRSRLSHSAKANLQRLRRAFKLRTI